MRTTLAINGLTSNENKQSKLITALLFHTLPCFRLVKLFSGFSKFHFDVHIFVLKLVHVNYIWAHVYASEVFETVKLLLASL